MIDKQILDKRAEELARPKQREIDNAAFLKIVKFRVAEETYGIELQYIQEVYPLQNLTKLPGLPSFIQGVINVRGQVVSVLDFKDIFQLSKDDTCQLNTVLILQSRDMKFGIAVDSMIGVGTAREDTLTLSLPTLQGFRSDYLKGITDDGLIILNGGKLLQDQKLVVDHRE